MESVQLAVVRTGEKWARFVIAIEPDGSRPARYTGTVRNGCPKGRRHCCMPISLGGRRHEADEAKM